MPAQRKNAKRLDELATVRAELVQVKEQLKACTTKSAAFTKEKKEIDAQVKQIDAVEPKPKPKPVDASMFDSAYFGRTRRRVTYARYKKIRNKAWFGKLIQRCAFGGRNNKKKTVAKKSKPAAFRLKETHTIPLSAVRSSQDAVLRLIKDAPMKKKIAKIFAIPSFGKSVRTIATLVLNDSRLGKLTNNSKFGVIWGDGGVFGAEDGKFRRLVGLLCFLTTCFILYWGVLNFTDDRHGSPVLSDRTYVNALLKTGSWLNWLIGDPLGAMSIAIEGYKQTVSSFISNNFSSVVAIYDGLEFSSKAVSQLDAEQLENAIPMIAGDDPTYVGEWSKMLANGITTAAGATFNTGKTLYNYAVPLSTAPIDLKEHIRSFQIEFAKLWYLLCVKLWFIAFIWGRAEPNSPYPRNIKRLVGAAYWGMLNVSSDNDLYKPDWVYGYLGKGIIGKEGGHLFVDRVADVVVRQLNRRQEQQVLMLQNDDE